MLSWIKLKRSDHPLDAPAEAKKVAEELSACEPFFALGQVSSYLDAVKTAEKLHPLRAMEIIDLLDRTARGAQRRLNYQYALQGQHMTRFQSNRVWTTAYDYWVQLAEAYRFCLSTYEVGSLGSQALKPHLPKVMARTLRARGQQLKWALMRYTGIDATIWRDLGKLYAIAEALGMQATRVQLYRNGQQDSSVQQELLRVLMLAVSAPDALLPVQIEVADRLIALCGSGLRLGQKARKDLLFGFELSNGLAPGRLTTQARFSTSTRFFGASEAARDILTPLIGVITQDRQVPRTLNLGIHPTTDVVLDTISHLAQHWSTEPPRRHAVRKRSLEKVRVVHGYDEVVANAGGLFLDYAFVSNDETWTIENEGNGGLGAFALRPKGAWLHAGALIAMCREERTSWAVGIVRRVTSDRDGNRLVGIETLSTGGKAVTVTRTGDASQPPAGSEEGEICLLLPSAGEATGDRANLLIRPGLCAPGGELEMRAYDRRYRLRADKMLMRGEDFELLRFTLSAS